MIDVELSTATSLWIDIPIIIICLAFILVIYWREYRRGKRTLTDQIILITMMTGYLVIYVYLTFIYRKPLEQRQLLSEPFGSYRHAFSLEGGLHIEHFSTARQILLNILVYVPPGCMLPALFSRIRHPYLASVGACTLLTLSTEILQWITRLGYCEVDDLINNMIGGLIGILLYHIGTKTIQHFQKLPVEQ